MTDTVAARASAIAQIRTHILAVTDVVPDQCVKHQPLLANLPSKFVAVVYQGAGAPPVGRQTLGNVMVEAHIDIYMWWLYDGDFGALDAIYKEAWDADRAIQSPLRGDSQLGSNITDLSIGDSTVTTVAIDKVPYLQLTIPISLIELEAESIAA